MLAAGLDAAAEPNSPNRVTPAQLREWALEYLRERDDEAHQFPELAGQSHYTLWMADYELDRHAFFVVAIVRPAGIGLLCGRGNSYEIRDFSECEAVDDLGRLFARMKRRFPVCRTLATL